MVKVKGSNLLVKKRKRALLASLFSILGFLSFIGWFSFPLEIAELSNRFELWKANVTEVQMGGVHGYLSDSCPSKLSGAGGGCTCVALIHGLGDNAMTWKKI